MPKSVITHTDKLGQPIKEGMHVVACHRNSTYICKVTKVHPRQLRIHDIKKTGFGSNGWLVYPEETVILSGPDVLAYILKYA